ncbi:MAG TPA: hypothetical protein VM889_03915 [Candidatus Thermoplasmatota archaeon]|nr:hypothetical protein [Candidatus Thermoplasmatota archaeon]
MNRDTVIGIVGAAVLIVAMVGVFVYERDRAAALLDDGDGGNLEIASLAGPEAQGVVKLGQSMEGKLNVTTHNLTKIDFTLAWKAAQGKDTLALTVTPPPGVATNSTLTMVSDSGTIVLTVDLANPKPARDHVTTGAGEWGFKVEFKKATGVAPDPVPVGKDESVGFTLATQLAAWKPAPPKSA